VTRTSQHHNKKPASEYNLELVKMAPKKKTTEVAADDIPMDDVPVKTGGLDYDGPISLSEDRIRILPGSSDTAASFEFKKEDHTLGNALRYIIMKNPDVEFCGYSIPHPSEALMNIRIQTYGGTTAREVLEKGLDDLMDLCDIVAAKFVAARNDFSTQMQA